jgi:16S rRNA (cytidine1402-2'-O)-methyltransferase
LYVVATPIGNLDDLSPRALEVLRAADSIVAEDTRHSGRLLSHFGVRTRMRALHDHNERTVAPELAQQVVAGRHIALVSDAGTPLVSDPGFVLVDAVLSAGARVVAIPGPSAVIAALSICGLATDRFTFEGFLPAREKARLERLQELKDEPRTWVCYESPHRIIATVGALAEVFGQARVIAVAKELTKLHEKVFRGTPAAALAWLKADPQRLRGEFVVLVSGAPSVPVGSTYDTDKFLRAALEELPPARAARMLAKVTGVARKQLYHRALELNGEEPDE